MTYLREHLAPPKSQREPYDNRQVANNAGGYVYQVDDFTRLERFLTLGSEKGTYYVGERAHTLDNTQAVKRAIETDGTRAVATILDFSHKGRIHRNSTALFALAIALASNNDAAANAAVEALPKVARTGSHLLEFVSYLDMMTGWGRRKKRAVANWYTEKSVEDAAFQVLKYRNRYGWTHRDVLRVTHPSVEGAMDKLFKFVVKGEVPSLAEGFESRNLRLFNQAQKASVEQIVKMIDEYNIPREFIPSEHLGTKEVWAALANRMPMTALIRNLATLTRLEIISPMNEMVGKIAKRISDENILHASRIHPLAAFSALITYRRGKGFRSENTWTPVTQITDALEVAVEKSFANVEATNKRMYIAVDVSGSMGFDGGVSGIPGLTPREGAAVLALITAKTEPNYYTAGFSCEGASRRKGWGFYGSNAMLPLNISARDSIESVMSKTDAMPMGGTDCSLPMKDALAKRMPVDVFMIITDSETHSGRDGHPVAALREYRSKMNIPAKMVVVAMTSTGFSIADPDDTGMLDVVGFDTMTPSIIADFIKDS